MSISNDDALEMEKLMRVIAFPSCDGDAVCLDEALNILWGQTEQGRDLAK